MIYKEGNYLESLDGKVYLTQEESKINPYTFPIIENLNLNKNLINIDYIEKLSEDRNISFKESIDIIKEINNLDSLSVVVNEEYILEDKDIINEFDDIVVKPLSNNDIVSIYCEEVCNQYLKSEDESVFDNILDENKLTYGLRRIRDKISDHPHLNRAIASGLTTVAIGRLNNRSIDKKVDNFNKLNDELGNTNKEKLKAIDKYFDDDKDPLNGKKLYGDFKKLWDLEDKINNLNKKVKSSESELNDSMKTYHKIHNINSIAGATAQIGNIYSYFKDKPRNVISKAILKLRRIYHNWMKKAAAARDSGIGNKLKNAAATLLQVIDKLLKKLQNATNKF